MTGRRSGSEWQRRWPPLLTLVVALAISLTVLPSSLWLDRPRQPTSLAYAPVPPTDDPVPPAGDLLAVGDGQGGGAGAAAAPSTTSPPRSLPGTGSNPSSKRCVGTPPRQTEDPLSPPCVPFFQGDNFGATHEGVTGEEIRVIVYVDGFIQDAGCSAAYCVRPSNAVYDLFEPEDPNDDESSGSKYPIVRALRVWQRYFNDRFQTYGRKVHLYVAFGPDGEALSPEARRADAAELHESIEPFAVISDVGAHEDAFLQAMAHEGVLNFGALFARPTSFYERYPGLIWGHEPSIEHLSRLYSSYICQRVVPHPTALNGSAAGTPRVLGVIKTADEAFPNLRRLAAAVEERLAACGARIAATAQFPRCCFAKDNSITHEYANVQMAEFRQRGITTVLWLGGVNGYYGPAADAIGYQPEWIILGDGQLDANMPPRIMSTNGTWHGRALAVSTQVYEPALQQQLCYQAFREVDQSFPEPDLGFTCGYYRSLFQLFVGVQVAGPRLGPASIDKGFHAIPSVRSDDPRVPACFYLPGDYTCVKDAQVEIWDATGVPPGDSTPGCWRSIEGGARYLPGEWPGGNVDAQRTGGEPCNGYNTTVLVDQL